MDEDINNDVVETVDNGVDNDVEDHSSNGRHYGAFFFKPEKNLEFFRLKKMPHRCRPW